MSAQLMIWLTFMAFVVFWAVAACAICRKGDFRADCETRWGKFHMQAKDRPRKLRKRHRDGRQGV